MAAVVFPEAHLGGEAVARAAQRAVVLTAGDTCQEVPLPPPRPPHLRVAIGLSVPTPAARAAQQL